MQGRLLIVVIVVIMISGCAGGSFQSTDDDLNSSEPSDNTDLTTSEPATSLNYGVKTIDYGDGVIEGGIHRPVELYSYYVTVIASSDETDRFNSTILEQNEAHDFVFDTNFDESYLIVTQLYPAPSLPDYRVESISRADGGLDIRINNTTNKEQRHDKVVETMLLKISNDQRNTPSNVSVVTQRGTKFETQESKA